MKRITDPNSPYTFFQQRFQYIYRHPEREFTSIVENVPHWPISPFDTLAPFTTSSIGKYAPCQGQPDLINAICRRENQQYGMSLQHPHVLVTNGALYGLSLIFRDLYQLGSVVLCQAPLLSNIANMLLDIGYQISYFSTPNGTVDIDWLHRNCHPAVRAIYINTPHNPTGDICSSNTVEQLVRLACERKIALVMDMVYDSFVFNCSPIVHPFLCSDQWEHLFVVNSMSKNYGAPGLRIGWIISEPGNIARLGARLDQESIAVCGSAQDKARQLLDVDNNPLVEATLRGKDLIEQSFACHPDIHLTPAKGAGLFHSLKGVK
ncbi:aminotransferase class I/II-fold pyridoxal phosphate-dependent enzyme [Scytonema hofmannii FACHB-248]|uniref:Aminotransferase n=1 Tax=Scytonema hofmannii FACHB-248 TaxID=1842502 RepID=A0ABR8GLH2_9CYAN|nr:MULTISPECIES: aminotransferase class I/II-fold pyridoxal phosphate-dependent enzyme [Nostocales]MBD2604042.1 aminotransferase class I/II-fold pyridoxal phosphate-dependent enzyme [Scytonema hofmannii FACHB-248]